jgi:ribosomal-protein-alanine N-acetyltransferase
VEEIGGAPFVGFVGLNAFTAEEPSPLPFAPGVEVGWRLARAVWGQGYAPEAARACLAFGFGQLGLEEIVSFTSVVNERSQQVMRKIGMQRDPADDFEHPRVPLGSALRPHVLYRLRREGGPAASVSSGEP